MTSDLIARLGKIVGPRFVSGEAEERYLYSMDQGTMPQAPPDAVVMPKNTEEVRRVVPHRIIERQVQARRSADRAPGDQRSAD